MCVYWDRNAYLYGYLNRQGEPVIPAQYRVAQPFQDGVAQVRTQDDEYLFIDKTGQVVFSPDDGLGVDEAYGDGMVAAQGYLDNGDYFVGFLDKQGSLPLPSIRESGAATPRMRICLCAANLDNLPGSPMAMPFWRTTGAGGLTPPM